MGSILFSQLCIAFSQLCIAFTDVHLQTAAVMHDDQTQHEPAAINSMSCLRVLSMPKAFKTEFFAPIYCFVYRILRQFHHAWARSFMFGVCFPLPEIWPIRQHEPTYLQCMQAWYQACLHRTQHSPRSAVIMGLLTELLNLRMLSCA